MLYADIQNVYNYKALGPDDLVPVENADGSYRKDPERDGYYVMHRVKNELGGRFCLRLGSWWISDFHHHWSLGFSGFYANFDY